MSLALVLSSILVGFCGFVAVLGVVTLIEDARR